MIELPTYEPRPTGAAPFERYTAGAGLQSPDPQASAKIPGQGQKDLQPRIYNARRLCVRHVEKPVCIDGMLVGSRRESAELASEGTADFKCSAAVPNLSFHD